MYRQGDKVKYAGPDPRYPVDSNLAEKYLSRDEIYTVSRVGAGGAYVVELHLIGVPAPLAAPLFKQLEH